MPSGKRKITKEDRQWAVEVKDRDGGKCVICGDPKMPNAHHILPREIKEFKHHVSNGITLCPSHHRFSRKISPHQNPIAFFKWMLENRPLTLQLALDRCEEVANGTR